AGTVQEIDAERVGLVDPGAGITHRDSLCVTGPLSEGDVNTLGYGLGESRAPREAKPDGTAYTHYSLLGLGRDLVVRYGRHGLTLTLADIERAFDAWWRTGTRNGMRFRLRQSAYRAELDVAIRSAERAPWLPRVIDFWTRWTRATGFPADGSPRE